MNRKEELKAIADSLKSDEERVAAQLILKFTGAKPEELMGVLRAAATLAVVGNLPEAMFVELIRIKYNEAKGSLDRAMKRVRETS